MQKIAVCLFIDGLDEFQGDEMMLIAELRQLLESPYIKICASSRPRNLFEKAFGYEDHQWKLALHSLTQGDMVQLARTRLYEDDAFCELVGSEDSRHDFITAITHRSQGVFLWTVLVIREVIREAHQAGTIDELKECLVALPTELSGKEGLYQRIVERSDPRYKKYMARLLLVMLEAGYDRFDWHDIHFLYDDSRNAAFATRECLDLDDKYRLARNKKADEAAIQRWEAAGRDTSCRGLFLACYQGRSGAHPRGINCQVDHFRLIKDTARQIRKWCPDFVDTNPRTWPQFLHRSVREYLSLPEISREMVDLAGPTFDPVLTKCRLRLAHSRLKPDQREMGDVERDFIEMIACVGHERRNFVRAVLPEFERIQDTKWSFIPVEQNEGRDRLWAKVLCCNYDRDIILHSDLDVSRRSQAYAWFLSLVARKKMVWYCEEHWSQIPPSDRQAIGTIIIAGLSFDRIGLAKSGELADLVRRLLFSGVNPNKRYTWIKHGFSDDSARQVKLSLWEAYIEDFSNVWISRSETDIWWALEVMQLLLNDGHADTRCCLPAGKTSFLSALTFELDPKTIWLNAQNRNWSMFAGRLHVLLDAHGLLTPKERYVAREQGWIS
jgi:hypothetical protein